MITLGCDVGSLFAKAVVLDGQTVRAARVVETTGTIARTVGTLLEGVLDEAGVDRQALEGIAATGRGRELVPDTDFVEEEMVCVGVAVRQHLPEVERVLEVGGQSITALLLDPDGDVVDFLRNDKCASGSGRFLEVMSHAMGIPIAELDGVAARSTREVRLSSQCGVFVESEVITHLNAGADPADVARGLCDAVARIIVPQARRLTAQGPFTLTGGVARIRTVVELVHRHLGGTYQPFPLDPQLAAAYGAALCAAE